MRLFIILVFLVLFSGCSSTTKNISSEGKFPVYGNWCGPSHPIDGTNPIPIDEVDAVCMRHDKCYAKKGYFSCACDNNLLKELFVIKENKWKGRKVVAGEEYKTFEKPIVSTIRLYFAVTGCNMAGTEASIPSLPIKAMTAVDTGTSFVGESLAYAIDKAYYVIQLPFLFVAKGLCSIVETPSCYKVDGRIKSGRGTKVIFQRK